MLQSIDKKKIYFYLLILIFLSTTFNFEFIAKFNKLNLINNIKIEGINEKESSDLEKKLKVFINKNIFTINKQEVQKILEDNNFIDSYNIVKIFPSKLLVNIKKTKFVGKTILDGKKFYIGENRKFTEISLVAKEYNLPQVFGIFQAHEFLKLQKILNKNGFNLDEIKKYYYFKNNRWDIQNEDGVVLKLPSQNVEKALTNYKSLLEANKIIKSKLIDLRMKNKIILKDEKK